MKIGFLRQSLHPELNIRANKTFGIELRLGLLWTFSEKLGHDVTILNALKSIDIPLLKSKGLDGRNWLANLNYCPDDYKVARDMDVLFVEASAPNMRFHYKGDFDETHRFTDENADSSYGYRTFKFIQEFRGKVVYYHHGTEMFIPWNALLPQFQKLLKDPKPSDEISPINFRKISQWFKPFEDKSWTVLHCCSNSEEFLNFKIRGECCYKLLLDNNYDISFYSTPQPHSQIDIDLPINPRPNYDLTWIGGEWDSSQNRGKQVYSRAAGVERYCNTDLYRARVIGRWENGYSRFPKAEFIPNTQTQSMYMSYSLYNDSYSAIIIQSQACIRSGLVQSRPTIALHGGSVLIADESVFQNVPNYVGKNWTVSSASEAAEKIAYLRSLLPEERDTIRRDQLSRFPRFSDLPWQTIFTLKAGTVAKFDWNPETQRFVDDVPLERTMASKITYT